MDDTQRIVKCGNLSLHTTGGFFKKRWHSKYLVLYDGSKSGIKRLELFDSEIKFKKQNPAKIIPLVDCVRVVTCQRHKTTYTFEVRTSDQFYLLAAQSFQDMNDWVNCLRLVAFGQSSSSQPALAGSAGGGGAPTASQAPTNLGAKRHQLPTLAVAKTTKDTKIDALLDKRTGVQQKPDAGSAIDRRTVADYARSMDTCQVGSNGGGNVTSNGQVQSTGSVPVSSVASAMGGGQQPTSGHPQKASQQQLVTASQAAAAAASALAKTRQRQPSLLGSCKPQPPTDSPFIQASAGGNSVQQQMDKTQLLGNIDCLDTMTPTVRGQLILGAKQANTTTPVGGLAQSNQIQQNVSNAKSQPVSKAPTLQASLDEEEENMLYCSIEDNPSEHNYRVKVIETELSLRCQLKCYHLTAPTTISQQYEQLGQFSAKTGAYLEPVGVHANQPVTFYQLIIGPQELTLLNDYAAAASLLKRPASQQQGLWSWPYQCIRRYGFDKDNCFMFEAGRKCSSGPGQFIVQTPKAYNIYQDVVKFVNELRSLSATTTNESPQHDTTNSSLPQTNPTINSISSNNGATINLTNPVKQHEKQRPVVTQIPVTWAPNSLSTSHGNNIETSDNTRQQFFDTLRQLESGGVGQSSKNVQSNSNNNIINSNIKSCESTSPNSSTLSSTTSHNQTVLSPSSAGNLPTSTQVRASSDLTGSKQIVNSDKSVNDRQTKCDTISSAATSEETDESGYEQGDDSVDSSHFKLKSIGSNVTRKRQANESMSSSSSTTSSGAGSPGHSVSRRSTSGVSSNGSNNFNGQGPSKRPPLSDATQRTQSNSLEPTTKLANTNRRLHGLHSLIVEEALGKQTDDFETSLIRDVYSEITKLHAKFAVTSGSAEDLMSTNSSNAGSAASSNNSCSGNNEETDDCGGILASRTTTLDTLTEPMYTNLSLTDSRRARSDSFVHLIDDERDEDDDEEEEEDEEEDMTDLDVKRSRIDLHSRLQHSMNYGHDNMQQNRVPQHQSYAQNQFDYLSIRCGGPIYPTTLNPIPECGELASSQPPKLMPKPSPNRILQTRQQTINNSQSIGYPQQQQQLNNRQQMDRYEQLNKSKQTGLSVMKSKLPTKHYVINDVQYAKISRNIRANYE